MQTEVTVIELPCWHFATNTAVFNTDYTMCLHILRWPANHVHRFTGSLNSTSLRLIVREDFLQYNIGQVLN